jgi:hypothetical protein
MTHVATAVEGGGRLGEQQLVVHGVEKLRTLVYNDHIFEKVEELIGYIDGISVGRIPIRIVFGGSPIQIFEKSGILTGIRIVFANIRTKISIRTKI